MTLPEVLVVGSGRKRSHGDVASFVTVLCPWCGESVALYVDPQTVGAMVQDCQVCCRPWELEVQRDEDGQLRVDVQRAE